MGIVEGEPGPSESLAADPRRTRRQPGRGVLAGGTAQGARPADWKLRPRQAEVRTASQSGHEASGVRRAESDAVSEVVGRGLSEFGARCQVESRSRYVPSVDKAEALRAAGATEADPLACLPEPSLAARTVGACRAEHDVREVRGAEGLLQLEELPRPPLAWGRCRLLREGLLARGAIDLGPADQDDSLKADRVDPRQSGLDLDPRSLDDEHEARAREGPAPVQRPGLGRNADPTQDLWKGLREAPRDAAGLVEGDDLVSRLRQDLDEVAPEETAGPQHDAAALTLLEGTASIEGVVHAASWAPRARAAFDPPEPGRSSRDREAWSLRLQGLGRGDKVGGAKRRRSLVSETLVRLDREGAVAWVWLERPDVHNAFNDVVVAQLEAALNEAIASDARAIVLGGRGRSFSAGADLNWMKSAGQTSDEDNVADAARLASMLRRLASAPQATIARVQGAALGGGLGLVAACDLAVAVERASFGFSEVKLGLIPAVISPHVIRKIGPGRAQSLFVTGERFKGEAAFRHGLVHQVVADEEALDAALSALLTQVLANAPEAITRSKELVAEVSRLQAAGDLAAVDDYTARAIAGRRSSPEGREGISAFLEKRSPSWVPADPEA